MGWLNSLFGKERPFKATPEQIAETWANVIATNTSKLEMELLDVDLKPQSKARFVIGCLLFSAFPFEVSLDIEFGAYGDVIRQRLRRRLFVDVQRATGAPASSFPDFDAMLTSKCIEYLEAWKAAQAGQDVQALGRTASQSIFGPHEPLATLCFSLTTTAIATLASLKGIGAKYEIVA